MKLTKVVLSFVLGIVCIMPMNIIAANTEFYAYTNVSTKHENYVKEKIAYFIASQNYDFDISEIEVGKGIDIIDANDVNKSLFPIWYENTIIATFLVADVDEEVSGVYSLNYVEQLNAIYTQTSEENPIWIIVYDEEIYGIIGNDVYNLNSNIGISDNTIKIPSEFNTNSTVINAKEIIDYNLIVIPKYPTTYINNWIEYSYSTSRIGFCAHYALSNILLNLGYTKYNYTYVNACLGTYHMNVTFEEMLEFLNDESFAYKSASSGYLTSSSVINVIYNNDFILIIGTNQSDASSQHAMIIVGYSIMSIETLYTVWDPHRTTSGYSTIDASTRLVTTTNSKTYKWDAGYIYDINK